MDDIKTSNSEMGIPQAKTFFDADFERWVHDLLAKNHVPGASVAIVDEDTVTSDGYGFARLPDVPATAETLYPMASTSKAFTAVIAGLMIEDGVTISSSTASENEAPQKVKWSTPICKIIPEDFVTSDPYITQNTTIEDALSHRSGLPGHEFLWGPWLGSSPAALTRTLRHLGPIVEPFRGRFQYNNIMYGIIGQVVEQLMRKDFDTVLKERIWNPLGMSSTFWGVEGARDAFKKSTIGDLDFARGYYWVESEDASKKGTTSKESEEGKDNRGYYVPEAYLSLGTIGPAGAQISNVNDYAKWIMALLEASKPPVKEQGERKHSNSNTEKPRNPISHELWREVTTPRMLQIPPMNLFQDITPLPPNAHLTPQSYALGWQMDPYMYPGHAVVHHTGGLLSFGAHVCLVPHLHFGVVAVGNSGLPANKVAEAICKELIGRKLGLSKESRRFGSQLHERKSEGNPQTSGADKNVEDTAKALHADSSIVTQSSGEEEMPPTSARDVEVDQLKIVGQYTNPAYGVFVVSQTTPMAALQSEMPNLAGIKITRKQEKKNIDQKGEDQNEFEQHKDNESRQPPLSISPQTPRTLPFRLLLHSPQRKHEYLIYDLEKLLARGDLSKDQFPELDPGYGHVDDTVYPCRREWIWESQEMVKQGAVIRYIMDESGQAKQLGLQLLRSDTPDKISDMTGQESSLPDGWEDKMVWFQKVPDD